MQNPALEDLNYSKSERRLASADQVKRATSMRKGREAESAINKVFLYAGDMRGTSTLQCLVL